MILILGRDENMIRIECKELEELTNYHQVNSPGRISLLPVIIDYRCHSSLFHSSIRQNSKTMGLVTKSVSPKNFPSQK